VTLSFRAPIVGARLGDSDKGDTGSERHSSGGAALRVIGVAIMQAE
jgi:hypothetical protein